MLQITVTHSHRYTENRLGSPVLRSISICTRPRSPSLTFLFLCSSDPRLKITLTWYVCSRRMSGIRRITLESTGLRSKAVDRVSGRKTAKRRRGKQRRRSGSESTGVKREGKILRERWSSAERVIEYAREFRIETEDSWKKKGEGKLEDEEYDREKVEKAGNVAGSRTGCRFGRAEVLLATDCFRAKCHLLLESQAAQRKQAQSCLQEANHHQIVRELRLRLYILYRKN